MTRRLQFLAGYQKYQKSPGDWSPPLMKLLMPHNIYYIY